MKLLAFETATEACSVALYLDGEVFERFEVAPRRHAEYALHWADALLAQAGIVRAQLDAVAVGRGPGAFTGVRLAIALGQGIALALDRPALPVSTLLAIAAQSPGERVIASIDARMGEVYTAPFVRDGGELRPATAETVGAPQAVVLTDASGGWSAVGTGFAASGGALRAHLAGRLGDVDASALPHAADVARLAAAALARGEGIAAERLEPAYLRDNVALTLEEQRVLRSAR